MVHSASRTDQGVHAYGQVAHFDMEKIYELHEIQNAVNYHLRPHEICILYVEQVDDKFHSRFSAKTKQYCYKIINRSAPPVLLKNKAWHVRYPLNIDAMKETSAHLLGKHDFSSFRAVGCQAVSPIKTIDSIRLDKKGDEIYITIVAKSFLYNQIRIIVGTLCDFGKNKFPPAYIKTIIEAKNRVLAGETAPGYGLYLEEIFYVE